MIGRWTFRSKDQAKWLCRQVLNRLAKKRGTPTDHQFLCALIERHPSKSEKIGPGIGWFEARPNKTGDLEFWLTRIDGTATDFSFHKCIDGTSNKAHVLTAMRSAISDQVMTARDKAFHNNPTLLSPFTGESITSATCEMDHWPPFIVLAAQFVAMVGGYDAIKTVGVDGERGRHFVDDKLTHKWQDFHRRIATLRPVSLEENRTIIPRINALMELDNQRREIDRQKRRGYDVDCSHAEHRPFLQRNNLTCPCLYGSKPQ